MTTRMVLKPETLDTIVATNLVYAGWSTNLLYLTSNVFV